MAIVHTTKQQDIQLSGRFFEILARGLKKLDALDEVLMDHVWSSIHSDFNSPFARNWKQYYCKPTPWYWAPPWDDGRPDRPDGARAYWTVTDALVKGQKRIRCFGFEGSCDNLPAYIFDRSNNVPPHTTDVRSISTLQGSSVDTSADIAAFSRIEDLTLCFASYGEENTQDYIKDWSGLETLLNSLKFLKSLKLRLPCSVGDDELANVYFRQDQVLPQPNTWERLESLMLWGMAARATEFCSLLLTKMPVQRDLSIASIELLTGTWEGVIID